MNKDVIYIDVEDDITAIIGKLKESKEKVVALVPPKRVGVLQSAVNLRLLERTAQNEKKRLVLITGNKALMALAAAAEIPVAKNLQSKPELPEIAALSIDDGDDIIDGSELPVGELERTADKEPETETDKAAAELIAATAVAKPEAVVAKKPKLKKSGSKVPNFNTFRKRLVLIVAGLILLVGFLVWATVYAPRATVVLAAKTTDTAVQDDVTLSTTAATDATKHILHVVEQKQAEKASVEFEPTGEKNAGEKATGTVVFSSNDVPTVLAGTTIPAGTELSDSAGNVFLTDSSVTIGPSNYMGASVGITAKERGAQYNGASGDMSGAPDKVEAKISDATSGGTDKTVKIVTAGDVQKASQELADKLQDESAIKNKLETKFGQDIHVITDSFVADKSTPVSSPEVGDEADGGATLTVEVTYSLLGVEPAELSDYLDTAAKADLDELSNQRVYDNGNKAAHFEEVKADSKSPTARLIATAKLGPDIKDDEVKEKSKGKKLGDIQADLQSINGVEDVDVKFWPFWVSTVPNDTKRISVEFKLDEQN